MRAQVRPLAPSPVAILLALVLVVVAACGSDAAYSVELHNATGVPIILVMSGTTRGELPDIPPRYSVQPDEIFITDWRRPYGSDPPASVRAEDQSGTLIFCRRFTRAEIQQLGFRVEIVRGDLRCGQ